MILLSLIIYSLKIALFIWFFISPINIANVLELELLSFIFDWLHTFLDMLFLVFDISLIRWTSLASKISLNAVSCDTSAFLMTWQNNYEVREGRSFIGMKLCIHCFQGYETR